MSGLRSSWLEELERIYGKDGVPPALRAYLSAVAHTNPSLSQAGFRLRNDNGSQTTATWVANENTNAGLLADTNYRVRFVVDETAGGSENNFIARLQYNRNAAGWNNVDAASLVVRSSPSSNFAEEDATTRQLTSGVGTFVAGAMDEDDGLAAEGGQVDYAGGELTEVEFCFQIRSADVVSGDTIQLRVIRSSGTVLENYAQTPSITVQIPKIVAVAQVVETNTLNAVTPTKGRTLEQLLETDSASAVSRNPVPVGQVLEVDVSQPAGKIKRSAISSVVSSEAAQPVSLAKGHTLAPIVEISTANQVRFPESLEFAHGSFQWTTSMAASSTIDITGLGFQPKAIRLYCIGLSSENDAASQTASLRMSVGFAASPAARGCVAVRDADALTTSQCGSLARSDCVAALIGSGISSNGKLDFNGTTADGFQLVVDEQALENVTIFWEAWGGDNITNVDVGFTTQPTTVTTVSVNTGFQPSVVMFAGTETDVPNTGPTSNHSTLCMGFASSPITADQIVVVGGAANAAGTTVTVGAILDEYCIAFHDTVPSYASALSTRGRVDQFNPTSFRISWLAVEAIPREILYMAIKGGNWKVGSYTINARTVGNTATSPFIPFKPNGALLVARDTAESTTSGDTGHIMALGSMFRDLTRQSMGARSRNGTANAEIILVLERDQCLVTPDITAGADGMFDIDSFNSDGFTIRVDDAAVLGDSISYHGFVAFGPTAPSGVLVAQVTEADTAQAVARIKSRSVAQSIEADTAQNISRTQSVLLGQSQETDTAQAVTRDPQSRLIGQSSETDTAQNVGHVKVRSVDQTTETDTSQGIASRKQKAIGQASESDTSQAVTTVKSRTLGQPSETDTSQAVVSSKVKEVGQTSESDTSQPITFSGQKTINVGQSTETDTAQNVSWDPKNRLVEQTQETDTAQAVARVTTKEVDQATETGTAQGVASAKVKEVAQSTETDTAQTTTPVKSRALGQSSETDTSQGVTSHKTKAVAQTVETDAAQGVARQKTQSVGQSTETDTSQTVAPLGDKNVPVDQTSETDAAQSIDHFKVRGVDQATETDTAQGLTSHKRKEIGQTSETDTANAATRVKSRTLGAPTEVDVAQTITQPAAVVPVEQVLETDLAQPVSWAPKSRLIQQVLESNTAQQVGARKAIAIALVQELDLSQAFTSAKVKGIAQASETEIAQVLTAEKLQVILQASDVEIALGITKILTVGLVEETDTAMDVSGVQSIIRNIVEAIAEFAVNVVDSGLFVRTKSAVGEFAKTRTSEGTFGKERSSEERFISTQTRDVEF